MVTFQDKHGNTITLQASNWAGSIGKEYTDRWTVSFDEWERMYIGKFGFTRTEMNSRLLGDMDRNIRILEVGCNVGNQLLVLQKMGFNNLYGIDIQPYAVEKAKERTRGINIIQGNAFDIPFKDRFFDLVFTSGVLIHFTEIDLIPVMKEIYRCTSRYIWAYEYYNKDFKEIAWRGVPDMMWKADYARIYLDNFPLTLIKEGRFNYLNEPNTDTMFLLEKK